MNSSTNNNSAAVNHSDFSFLEEFAFEDNRRRDLLSKLVPGTPEYDKFSIISSLTELQKGNKPGQLTEFSNLALQIKDYGTKYGTGSREYNSFLWKFKLIANDRLDENAIKR